MRPLYLEMTAFGSYARTTALPFEELRHGLYLVTGDTGAGKTTIFDAIVFALYGVASGSDRKGDMLHCDHVPKSTDTVVKLRFSQNGKEYTVSRTIHFAKKRGGAEQYADGVISALLTEPDRAPTEGSGRVTARCEELLGLNAEQFRKIVMLAQGEFREFLKADSDKKNEILGKLFDNSLYVYYQNLFLEARDALRALRTAQEEALRTQMEAVFLLPEGEAREDFLSGHPALMENLSRLTEKEEAALAQRKAERAEVNRQLEQLTAQKGAAETVNALLAQLENARGALKALEALDGETEKRAARYLRADAAFHRAKPAVERHQQAVAAVNTTCAAIEALSRELAGFELAADAAAAQLSADETQSRELDALKARLEQIERQLPRYRELAALRQQQESAEMSARQAAAALAEKERTEAALEEELAALRERLEALAAVDAELQSCRYEEQNAKELERSLSGDKGILAEIKAVSRLEDEQNAAQEALRALTVRAGEAAARYAGLYRGFIAGQAGLLAEGLRAELESAEETSCPVCGSRVCRAHLSRLAPKPAETPDQDAVERAKDALDELEAKRSSKKTETQTLLTRIESRRQTTLEKAQRILADCESWEKLSDERYIAAALAEARLRVRETEAALAAALARQTERERGKRTLSEKEGVQQTLRSETEALREKERGLRAAAAEAEIAIREKRALLLHESEESARAEKVALETKRDALAAVLEEHRVRLSAAREARDTCLGSLKEKKAALETLRQTQSAALAELTRTLDETGFFSPEEVGRALEAIGEQDGESWLRAEQKALADHEYAKKRAREQIETLTAQTAGKQQVDLAELEQRLAALGEAYAAADEACARQDALLSNHRGVKEKAREIKARLAETDGAWKRIGQLAALSGGVNSEGGKLSFDRYVMGAVFREILEMANRRMELMSGGRYELVHKSAADRRNAKAGLEIEVLDNNTGVQRPSASLSGGESFFTSLALALGLSDAVQNRAGGKQMDALFIDEGFGTLSDDVLDKALEVLGQLSEGKRLVGIISHVDKLDESIAQKIRVKNGEKGSSLTLELS